MKEKAILRLIFIKKIINILKLDIEIIEGIVDYDLLNYWDETDDIIFIEYSNEHKWNRLCINATKLERYNKYDTILTLYNVYSNICYSKPANTLSAKLFDDEDKDLLVIKNLLEMPDEEFELLVRLN